MQGLTEVPTTLDLKDPAIRRLLVQMRETIVALRASQSPLPAPSNFKVTALAFANLVEWSRVTNADYYEVMWNSVATLKTATIQAVGDSQRWVDNVGQVGISRTYWVRARRYTGASSTPAGPKVGVTLASNAGVNPTQPPPPGHIQISDAATGHIVYIPISGAGRAHIL